MLQTIILQENKCITELNEKPGIYWKVESLLESTRPTRRDNPEEGLSFEGE